MEISQAALAQLSLIGALLGIFLGLCYDFFSFGSGISEENRKMPELPLLPNKKVKKKKKKRIFIFCKDLLFCLFSAICVILLFYEYNHGKIRFSALFTILAGGALYALTLRRIVLPVLQYCRFGISALVRYLLFFILWPLRKICSMLGKYFKKLLQKQKAHRLRMARNRATLAAFSRIDTDGGGLLPLQNKERNEKNENRRKKEAI